MAPKGGGESKTGIIVALVLFILLSIILGVTTYTGYDAVNAEKTKAADSDKKAKDKDKLADWYRFAFLTTRMYGGEGVKDEKSGELDKSVLETVGTYRGNWADGTGAIAQVDDPQKNQNVRLLQDLDKRYGWDEAGRRPKRTMADERAQLTKELTDAKAALATEKARADDLDKQLANKNAELKSANDNYISKLDNTGKSVSDDRAKLLKQVNDLQNEVNKVNGDLNKMKQEKEAEIARLQSVRDSAHKVVDSMRKSTGEHMIVTRQDLGGVLKKLETELEQNGAKLTKLEERIKTVNRLADVVEKGRIYRMDRSGEMPFLDLGSSHALKAGQTFSVHGRGPDGRPMREPKGSVEVVKVLGERLSQARVTGLVDSGRDPITPGDALVNPAWSPNQVMHVAIVGTIDLTGDGRDSRDEFIRVLSQQGVVVDAYLDLRDQRVVGQVTSRTDFLILGGTPDGSYVPKRDGDPKADKSDKTGQAMALMQEQATKDGVQSIRLKDFIAMTGYRVPRSLSADNGVGVQRPSVPGKATPAERRDVPKLEGKEAKPPIK